ncbi:MAG: alpha-galactosidase [Oscillospiraceae bacterium]|nr:alpha-galactosidase [Oscillospiraceae bacterium]
MGILGGVLLYKKGRHNISFDFSQSTDTEDFSLAVNYSSTNEGTLFSVVLTPKTSFTITACTLTTDEKLSNDVPVFLNGYQTWTDSTEVTLNYSIKKLNPLAKPLIGMYGDYGFYKQRQDKLQSWTYTYIRNNANPSITLYGSVSEKSGYTIFEYDKNDRSLCVVKDCKGLTCAVGSPYFMFDIFTIQSEESAAFDSYFSAANIPKPHVTPCTGWTSWYNYYTAVTQEHVLENLSAFSSRKLSIDYFQIDDGFQEAVGDWLYINEKFSQGMDYLADEIHRAGYKAGLWLAPIICEKTSRLYKEHPDWVLCKAGLNPGWSGVFYALDFYNPEVQAYLREVFDTVLNKWNYDMVKLDFLYAAALKIPKNKNRGQVMCEFFGFLREISGDKIILGCGAPLGCAFGLFDYCRVSSDIALMWEDKFLSKLHYRERVSTFNALKSTIGRYQLSGRAFYNDPDVFILRDSNNKLSKDQKYTLFMLNGILGGLVFTSDNINEYSDEQMELFNTLFAAEDKKVKSVAISEIVTIHYSVGDKVFCLLSNLTTKKALVQAPLSGLLLEEKKPIAGNKTIELRPYQTVIILKS